MKRTRSGLYVVAALAMTALVAWPVYAHCGKCAMSAEDMAKRMQQSDFNLTKAIELAQKTSGANALSALTQIDQNAVTVDVFCLKDGKLTAVTVDVSSGKVKETREVEALPVPTEKSEQGHGG
jgi:hypothetical protein